jgi:glycosyltransferase involved in cell wall biosynthesis
MSALAHATARPPASSSEPARLKLLIVIPALNEEQSIEDIISRSLAAAATIRAQTPVTDVEVTVVSDGSTDGTVERASRFGDRIKLIVFEKNRGYGAAIQEAWRQSDAELLGFLDADGTCDPLFFATLCKELEAQRADIALGCRMNRESRMPLVRRIGNTGFALLLSLFSSTRVRDTASGIRVVRRSSLERLLPLPTGMHFTPAMSARALLSDDLTLLEMDMPYHERQGESKLRVIKDGLRFLRIILETAFLQRPSRPLELLGTLSLLGAVALMLMPTAYYLRNGAVLEWMIYRFIVSALAGTAACLLFCSAYLCRRVLSLTLAPGPEKERRYWLMGTVLRHRHFWLLPSTLMLAGGALVLRGFVQLVELGHVYEHWSRFIAMSFLFTVALILIVTRLVDYVLGLVSDRQRYLRERERA